MKKIFISILALFSFIMCNAQLKTHSTYDVDGNGAVTVSDVTSTVDKVMGKAVAEKEVVTAEDLNAQLAEINQKYDLVLAYLRLIREGLGIADPYNGHTFVDLGLSVKWATMNVGANRPEDYGDYFAWGETRGYLTGKTFFATDWNNYFDTKDNGKSFVKYNIDGGKTVLDSTEDAASKQWGGTWRMPTKAEQQELSSNCTWEWTTCNGVYGRKGTSKINGNTIFLPAAGYRYEGKIGDAGTDGFYWSNSMYSYASTDACLLYISSGMTYAYSNSNRLYGHSVRAVCP